MTAAYCPHCGETIFDENTEVISPCKKFSVCDGFLNAGSIRRKLGPMEISLVKILFAAWGRYVSTESLHYTLYSLNSDIETPALKVISVFICRIRKALDGVGLKIENKPCMGYMIDTGEQTYQYHPPRKIWEPDEDERLLQHYNRSTVEELSAVMGRTSHSLIGRYHRLKRAEKINGLNV